MAQDKIKCLACGRWFSFLPPHLRRAHGISADEYRREFGLAAGTPLASESYRAMQRDKLNRMIADGTLTYEHLPQAVEAAKSATDRPKRGAALDKQREVMAATKPWQAHRLPPGAKRADGRDADHAREYQREYRRLKKLKKG